MVLLGALARVSGLEFPGIAGIGLARGFLHQSETLGSASPLPTPHLAPGGKSKQYPKATESFRTDYSRGCFVGNRDFTLAANHAFDSEPVGHELELVILAWHCQTHPAVQFLVFAVYRELLFA